MFDALSDKLQKTFRNLRGLGKISETNVSEALREVRMALLDADVNFKVAKQFIARVKEKSLGEEVVASIQPGQQIVKIISDEMVALLGAERSELDLPRGFAQPLSLMMCGLHGSGKTTSSGKLARLLAAEDRKTLLVGADVYRPAAMDQIETLARQLDLPCFLMRGEQDVLKIADGAMAKAKADGIDVVIFDTAGRLQIDEPLVQELVQLRDRVQPREILLVLDSATGQEAVSVATHFDEALGITGAILTKLDGDARGGAALSFREVTGKPIKFAGTGEKLDDFEPFHPDRMASRILGMGDVVSLVEKAAEAIDEETALKLEERMKKGHFTLEDFLDQLRQIKKLGSLESIVEMLPGGESAIKGSDLGKGRKGIPPNGGDDLQHDPAGTPYAGDPQRAPPPPHRHRQRHDRRRAQQPAQALRRDAKNDEENGQVPENDGQDGRRGGHAGDGQTARPLIREFSVISFQFFAWG